MSSLSLGGKEKGDRQNPNCLITEERGKGTTPKKRIISNPNLLEIGKREKKMITQPSSPTLILPARGRKRGERGDVNLR